jgi:hypothetical protein
MPTALPILQPVPIFKNKDYREVLVREMEAGRSRSASARPVR